MKNFPFFLIKNIWKVNSVNTSYNTTGNIFWRYLGYIWSAISTTSPTLHRKANYSWRSSVVETSYWYITIRDLNSTCTSIENPFRTASNICVPVLRNVLLIKVTPNAEVSKYNLLIQGSNAAFGTLHLYADLLGPSLDMWLVHLAQRVNIKVGPPPNVFFQIF